MELGKETLRSDLEHSPVDVGPAGNRGPVEIAVRAENQRGRSRAIRNVKAVQHRQHTHRRHHKD